MGVWDKKVVVLKKKVAVLKINRIFAVGKKYVKPLSLNAMKHKIILLCCLLWISVVYGQGTGTLYAVSVEGQDGIARVDLATGNIVTYSNIGIENHFSLTDLNTIIDVKVADNLWVTDFEIIDGLVFFCGYITGSAFLGWFDIDSLFYHYGPIHIDNTLSSNGVHYLENIEVFRESGAGKFHIAGYGRRYGATTQSIAFEAIGMPFSMRYRSLVLWEFSPSSDITDMAVTDNYVVFLGRDLDGGCPTPLLSHGLAVTLHAFPKYNMFIMPLVPPYFFQTINVSYLNGCYAVENNDPYFNSKPKITHVDNDIVAVCSHRRDYLYDPSCFCIPPPSTPCGINPPTPTNTYLVLRTYDLSPLSSNNPITMQSVYAAELYAGEVNDVKKIVFDPMSKKYLVLHCHKISPVDFDYAVTSFDFSGSVVTAESEYQTAYSTVNLWTPVGLYMYNSTSFLVHGHDNTYPMLKHMFWKEDVNWNAVDCAIVQNNPVIKLSPQLHKKQFNEKIPSVWTPLSFFDIGQEVTRCEPCQILCH